MKKYITQIVAIVVGIVLTFAGNAKAATTLMAFTGPGILAGGTTHILSNNTGYSTSVIKSGSVVFIDFYNQNATWTLTLKAPPNQTLGVGLYSNVAQFGNSAAPGQASMSFGGNGYSVSSTAGYFEIFEIEYNAQGKIDKLAVDYYQKTSDSSWTMGSTRLKSDVAITAFTIPEPGAPMLALLAVIPLIARRNR